MSKKLKVLEEDENGKNIKFTDGDTNFYLKKAIELVENGKYPDYHVVNSPTGAYIRSNPDNTPLNNLDCK